MSELLPCPFCGGEASVKVLEYDDDCKVWGVFCESDLANEYSHGHFVDNYATEAEAIAAWNSRAQRTCNLIEDGDLFHCSNCGSAAAKQSWAYWIYCPNCGCKVVE